MPSHFAPSALGVAVMLAMAASAQAQDSRGLSIVPVLSISQSYTDNVAGNRASESPQWEAVTQVSPGVRISSRGGRIQGNLDYTLNALAYARDSSRNGVQQALAASMLAEVIDRTAYVDARASIAQRSISAFAAPPSSELAVSNNRSEVRTLSISPWLQGRAGSVDWRARYTLTRANAIDARAPDSENHSLVLAAGSGTPQLGWNADHVIQRSAFQAGRDTQTARTGLSVYYSPDPEWRANVRAGRETTDVLSLASRDSTTYGAGVQWTPTPRTLVGYDIDQRYFGRSHALSVQHRMRRVVLRATDSRGSSEDSQNFGLFATTEYDNLFRELSTVEPDPVRRDALVRSLLAQRGTVFTRAVSLQRRQELSAFWSGVGVSLNANLYRSTDQRLDPVASSVDDLVLGSGGVRQSGFSVNASYVVSSQSGLNFGWSRLNRGSLNQPEVVRQDVTTLSYSTSFAWRTSFSLVLRRSVINTVGLSDIIENSAVATLGYQF
jgi:uncharacterized protein (PEP-CTERM system associated)